jgi:hypothetical protein
VEDGGGWWFLAGTTACALTAYVQWASLAHCAARSSREKRLSSLRPSELLVNRFNELFLQRVSGYCMRAARSSAARPRFRAYERARVPGAAPAFSSGAYNDGGPALGVHCSGLVRWLRSKKKKNTARDSLIGPTGTYPNRSINSVQLH